MSSIVLSCITNHISDENEAEAFSESIKSCKRHVSDLAKHLEFGSGLNMIFIQFQYDCGDLPNAVRGLKIGRLSSKKQHIEAYVGITREEFQGRRI